MLPQTLRALFLVLATTTPAWTEVPLTANATCLLAHNGQQIIRGDCVFSTIDEKGSFQIMSLDGAYFAQVLLTAMGQGDGYWNEISLANHAHTPLGPLKQSDACWINAKTMVCAWAKP
jgi:hypothetical protein